MDEMYRRDERVLETMLARLALAAALPLPTGVLQPALDVMVSVLRRQHPGAFQRLTELPDAEVLIDPVDLPMAFVMRLGPKGMRLRLAHRHGAAADAVIRARPAGRPHRRRRPVLQP